MARNIAPSGTINLLVARRETEDCKSESYCERIGEYAQPLRDPFPRSPRILAKSGLHVLATCISKAFTYAPAVLMLKHPSLGG